MIEHCIINSLIQRKDDEKIALQDDKICLSYSKLLTLLEINSRRIKNSNEQNIGVIAENTIEFVVAFLSIIYAGKTAVILTNSNKGIEIIKTYKIKTIFAGKANLINVEDVTVLYTILERNSVKINDYKRVYHYEEDYIAVIMTTSGTTGEGGVVPILYKNLNKRIFYTNMYYSRDDGCKELVVVPIYLTLGNQQQLLAALYLGMHIYIYSGIFFPRKILDMINKEIIDYISFVPTMLSAFVDFLEEQEVLLHLKGIYIAGDVLQTELIKKAKKILKTTQIYSAYGMTEIAPICIKKYSNENEYEELKGVGKPIKDMQIKILSETGGQEPGEVIGEICIRHSMLEVERYSDDGWFHTGDIGYLDECGELILCGRLKNMLIRNGHNIFPEIIERKIRKSKMVKETVVFMDNMKLIANIVVDNRDVFQVAELIKYCKANLEQEEIPCDFRIVDFIEKNESMKIVRRRTT